jgi:hypothetical protein
VSAAESICFESMNSLVEEEKETEKKQFKSNFNPHELGRKE